VKAGFYAISSIGSKLPGASGAIEVQMAGIAKDDSIEHYTVVNEYVCSRVAAAVCLPVPPGTIAKKADGTNMFVSLRFTAGPTSLPPAHPAELAADHPDLAAGIVAFDCWVGNWDRHAGNLAYVPGVSGVSLFDHGRTLLRMPNGEGVAQIDAWRDKPHVYDSSALLKHVDDYKLLSRWSVRIAQVPSEIIGDACGTAVSAGACTIAEGQAVERFLEHRKTRIMGYLSAEKGKLPLVSGWEASP
jgi:hypothetical protein